MQCLERLQSPSRLMSDEISYHLTVHQFADQARDRSAPDSHGLGVMVLNDGAAGTQTVQLTRVPRDGAITWIALGIEQLRRPVDARPPFNYTVDLPLPARAQELLDHVLAAQDASGEESEGGDGHGALG